MQLIQQSATLESITPNSLAAEIVMTANFREWLHVLRLRTAKAAHPQMRHLAGMIWDELSQACPAIFLHCDANW